MATDGFDEHVDDDAAAAAADGDVGLNSTDGNSSWLWIAISHYQTWTPRAYMKMHSEFVPA
jgi:hypothetical protein